MATILINRIVNVKYLSYTIAGKKIKIKDHVLTSIITAFKNKQARAKKKKKKLKRTR